MVSANIYRSDIILWVLFLKPLLTRKGQSQWEGDNESDVSGEWLSYKRRKDYKETQASTLEKQVEVYLTCLTVWDVGQRQSMQQHHGARTQSCQHWNKEEVLTYEGSSGAEQQADHELVVVVNLGSQQRHRHSSVADTHTHTHTHTVMSAAVYSSALADSTCALVKGSVW